MSRFLSMVIHQLRSCAAGNDPQKLQNFLEQYDWVLRDHSAMFDTMDAAVRNGCLDNLDILLHKQVPVDLTNEFGKTVLQTAAVKKRADSLSYLIQKGADVNHRDHSGNTSLYHVAGQGNEEAAIMLIDHGADAGIPGNDGRTPVEHARFCGHDDLAVKLIGHLAKRGDQRLKARMARLRRHVRL